jgi:iron complex outermembrane recepter protein
MRNVLLLTYSMFVLLSSISIAQTVSGTVTDGHSGSPLQHANVLLMPGNHGAATDADGRYAIRNVPKGNYEIVFSYVGYASQRQELRVSDKDISINAKLNPVSLPGPRIEVSAMRARERFSPVTFANLDMKDIDEQYIVKDLPVLLADLPSITFYSESGHGVGPSYIRLRGFDQRRLAIMINGVPQNDPEDHNTYWSNFADLLGSTEEIQVQRGAGSAFYGPPAIGGSINIVTGDFANRKGISLSTGYGSYNTRRFAIAGGSGLIDNKYVIYGRLSQISSDGYRDHSFVKKGTYYFAATRYDENFTTRVNVYGGPIEDGLVYTGLPKFAIGDKELRKANYNYWESDGTNYTYTQTRRPQEREEFSQPHYELLNEWKINDDLSFSSALFHVRGYGYFDYDGTGYTDAGYYRMTPEFGFENAGDPTNPLIHAYVDNNQWGWLPRVSWKHDGGTLTAGLELRTHQSLHYGNLLWAENLPEGYDPDRRYYEYSGQKQTGSAYLQEQYAISERMNLMTSVQYVFNQYRIFDEKFVGTDFKVNYHFLNPRIGLNYNLTPEWNVYGNLSYTKREPRLKNLYDAAESGPGLYYGNETPQFERNPDGSYDFNNPYVKPEALVNVELGAGYVVHNLSLLVNGYFMDFTDEIIKKGQLDRFGQPITGNADKTSHMGLEFVAKYTPLRELEFSFNALISRSRLETYSVFSSDTAGNSIETKLDGNRIAGFPEQMANARLTWRDYGITASLSMKYVGEQFTDNFENQDHKVDPFTVMNATLGYRLMDVFGLRALNLRLGVYNVLDKLYAASGEGNEFFVAAERNYMFDIAFEL